MELHLLLLNLLGYALYEKPFDTYMDTAPLDIKKKDNSIVPVERTKREATFTPTGYCVLFTKLLYNTLIFCILAWQLIYTIIVSIKHTSIAYFGTNFFQIIFISQYILGVYYFASNHFYQKIKLDTKIKTKLKLFYSIAVITAIILSIIFVVLVAIKKQINEMSILNEYQDSNAFHMIVLFLALFYGYSIFLINMITFSAIMTGHKSEATDFTKQIDTYIKGSVAPSEKLNSISRELDLLRNDYNGSVIELNIIFSSLTVFGLVYTSFTLKMYKNTTVDPFGMINLALFLLTEYVYISSAKSIRESSAEIQKKVNKYIRKSALSKISEGKKPMEFSEHDNSTEYIKKIYIYVSEIVERLTWVQLQETVEIEWATFNIFGIELKDTMLFEKLAGLIFAFLVASDLGDMLSF